MGLLKRRPSFQLSGLGGSGDGLYDGSFIAACVRWWNHLVDERADLRKHGYRPIGGEDVRRLTAVPPADGAKALRAMAAHVAMDARLSNAAIALAYAFAIVVEAAAAQLDEEPSEANWLPAEALTGDDLTELALHYSQEGWAREIDQWSPYWKLIEGFFPDKVGSKVVASLTKTFDDQVDRWSAAEGFDLRRSIGGPDFALISADTDAPVRLPNFVELLFEWGGRIRLAERLITEGYDLKEIRYQTDSLNPIDYFYEEAFERYLELAGQSPPPISKDAERAAISCLAWLEDGLDQQQRLGVSTAAIRGYLWRRAEQTSGQFLEPALSTAVEKSRMNGECRGPDEPFALTLAQGALECLRGDVHLRFGSVGGILQGPRSFEKAMIDTTDDFDEHGIVLDEKTLRQAWEFGVAVFEVERVLLRSESLEQADTL